jgi:murein DD-endopeptidase MepM/ murein hydrolase activator NlpD
MIKNRFYTLMLIPEKTARVYRVIIPAWVARGSLVSVFFLAALGTLMTLNYWYVMSRISENKQLRLENRKLRQQVQIFQTRMETLESTMNRVKTFSTRLKVITNIEDRDNLIQSLNQKLPDASRNIGDPDPNGPPKEALASQEPAPASEAFGSGEKALNALPVKGTASTLQNTLTVAGENPDETQLRLEFESLDFRLSDLNNESILLEQVLHDQYELLADQRSFLSALPTRRPSVGYFTSGFGVRRSPYGGIEKMHEGLDIANQIGTPIIATADGTVLYAEAKPGYGQTVILDHGYGLETWYGHTSRIFVKEGQKIKRGEQIAQLGNSGRSTGPHLHYEVRINGTAVDPLSYILEN